VRTILDRLFEHVGWTPRGDVLDRIGAGLPIAMEGPDGQGVLLSDEGEEYFQSADDAEFFSYF
jgi:hypothetical protein